MRGDSLVHVCHMQNHQALTDLGCLVRLGLDCAMVCGMAPDPGTDDYTLKLYQTCSSGVRASFFPGLCGFHMDDPHVEAYVESREKQFPKLWKAIGEVFAHKGNPTWTPNVAPYQAVQVW